MTNSNNYSFSKVERFITKKGFVFRYTNIKDNMFVKANFKLGFFLRKILLFYNDELLYTFKQENLIQQLFLFLIPGFPTESIPNFHLYKHNKEIAQTANYKYDIITISFSNNLFTLQKTKEKNMLCIEIFDSTNILIAQIKKDKLREGKKNIYNVCSYKDDILDNRLLLLLTAFSDFVFFPETKIFSWNMLEYNEW